MLGRVSEVLALLARGHRAAFAAVDVERHAELVAELGGALRVLWRGACDEHAADLLAAVAHELCLAQPRLQHGALLRVLVVTTVASLASSVTLSVRLPTDAIVIITLLGAATATARWVHARYWTALAAMVRRLATARTHLSATARSRSEFLQLQISPPSWSVGFINLDATTARTSSRSRATCSLEQAPEETSYVNGWKIWPTYTRARHHHPTGAHARPLAARPAARMRLVAQRVSQGHAQALATWAALGYDLCSADIAHERRS